ncbi:Glycoside hydrolase [Flavobacterium longum]|uniref:glycosyltransferase family 4 protein n=1 Tax=Flavobacterium longum TaxID=1299340 RepID=UPI0039E75A8F
MKIAFLTPEFPHPKTGTSGGIGTSIQNMTRGLAALGYQPLVLVYGQDRDEHFEENGVSFYRVRNVKIKGLSWYFTRKKIQRIINQLHADDRLDVVEAPDWTGITSFINTKCKVVIRLNGSDTYFCHLDKRAVKWANRFHEKRALQNADAVLSVSRFTADVTNEIFGLHRDFTIIPNSIDAASFAPAGATSSQTILYFGTLIRKKGLLELPHIFNKVHEMNPAAELVLVGRDARDIQSGNASTWAMMQPLFTDSARKKVSYRGGVAYTEIQSCIREASVCVFPTFAEALPVSWIEAMAMEKAIVASDIGWAPEVIEDGISGWLVHPANHELYARKITALLEDAVLRESIGKAARQRVLSVFDIAVVARSNAEYYQRLLNK